MSIANALRATLALGAVAAGLAAATSCGRYQGVIPEQRFELAGAHARLDCAACHGPEPFGPLDTDCASCHEADRKAPDHYAAQTCNDAGCHTLQDLTWGDALDHDFLPLLGAHDRDCTDCHDPKLDPELYGPELAGLSTYCWSCHEEADRPDDGHYALVGNPLDPLYRWDCGPCHDPQQGSFITNVAGSAITGDPEVTVRYPYEHPVRIPHGAVIDNGAGACVLNDVERDWVVTCDSCHPTTLAAFVCLTCHVRSHEDAPERRDEALCLGCHESGGPDAVGAPCDSLP